MGSREILKGIYMLLFIDQYLVLIMLHVEKAGWKLYMELNINKVCTASWWILGNLSQVQFVAKMCQGQKLTHFWPKRLWSNQNDPEVANQVLTKVNIRINLSHTFIAGKSLPFTWRSTLKISSSCWKDLTAITKEFFLPCSFKLRSFWSFRCMSYPMCKCWGSYIE